MDYSRKKLHLLITNLFSGDQLLSICYDMPVFKWVYDSLASDTTRTETIDRMIDVVKHRGLLGKLLDRVQRNEPELYRQYQPYHIDPDVSKMLNKKKTGMLVPNPFTYGNAINDPERFIGRRLEVDQIQSRLLNAEFESSAIVGERRIGKTSLLKYLARPEVIAQAGFSLDHYVFIYLDLQIIDPSKTPTDFWKRILQALKRHINEPTLHELIDDIRQEEIIDAFILDDLFTSIDDLDLHIVLLLDEFERVTQNEVFDVDFFSGLRAIAIHHNLALIPSSRRELIELTHSKAVQDSPFFNIFSNVTLRPFTQDEVDDLINRYLRGHQIVFAQSDVDYLLKIAGPHPYFLQIACCLMYEGYNAYPNQQQRQQYVEHEFRTETAPMFSVYWQHSTASQRVLLVVLALRALIAHKGSQGATIADLKRYHHRAEQTILDLVKRGLALDDGGTIRRYQLISDGFARWIADELVSRTGDADFWQAWCRERVDQLNNLTAKTRSQVLNLLSSLNKDMADSLGMWLLNPRTVNNAVALLKNFQRRDDKHVSPQPQTTTSEPFAVTAQESAVSTSVDEEFNKLSQHLVDSKQELRILRQRAARYKVQNSVVPLSLEEDIARLTDHIESIKQQMHALIT